MKKLLLFAMVVAGLSIFNACEKSEELIDQSVNGKSEQSIANAMFEGLDTIAFSVEDNRLVFESDEEYQKCIDFLGTIDVEDYKLFEKEIGFNSLLSTSISANEPCTIEDDKFATLLNPEMEIIVGHYLFTLNNEEEKVNALFIGEDYDLKSVKSTVQEFSYDDDVFGMIKGENLKSVATDYCGQENSVHHLNGGITTSVDYNKYGIYNSLVSKITSDTLNYLKHETVNSPLGVVPVDDQGNPTINSRCFYKRVGKQNEIIYSNGFYSEYSLKKTLWDNRRRLVGFRLDMLFSYKLSSTGPIITDRNMIECHQY